MQTIITIIITAMAMHFIEAAIRKFRNQEIHDKHWLVEKEKEWIIQLTEELEATYSSDLINLMEVNDQLSLENENCHRDLVLEQENHNVTLRQFEAFCEELRKDSISSNFLIRFDSKSTVRDYYNASLTKIISIMNQEVAA